MTNHPMIRHQPRPQIRSRANVVPVPISQPPGWEVIAWRRPIHWPLLLTGAAITALDVALILTSVAFGPLPAIPAALALSALAVLWHHYLTRPISTIHAHRRATQEPTMTTTHTRHLQLGSAPTLLAAALGYSERGWHVFPLRPGSKKPAVPNHPAHLCDHSDPRCAHGHSGWEQRATTNSGRIERAWTRRFGIGIACGPSHLVVVDLDIPKVANHRNGIEHLAHLEHEHGDQLPATFTVTTPRGGQHRYYRAPAGPALPNTASRAAPYIDTRATGGYVVAPPTRINDGGRYRLTANHRIPELPAWFAELIARPQPPPAPCPRPVGRGGAGDARSRYVTAAVEGELHRLTTAGPGTRNNTLFTVAVSLGQLVGAGVLDHDDAQHSLLQATAGHVNAGAYSHAQALTTIASGLHRGTQQPRPLPANLTRPESHQ